MATEQIEIIEAMEIGSDGFLAGVVSNWIRRMGYKIQFRPVCGCGEAGVTTNDTLPYDNAGCFWSS